MAVKGINDQSKCFVDVYSEAEVDEKFRTWNSLSSADIPAYADLNWYTNLGFFKCTSNSSAATIGNRPTNEAFSLLVENHAGTKQTVTRYQTGLPTTWVRNLYNGVWGAWTRINNTSEDPQIYSGTTSPSGSLGKNGDIYFMY